MFFHINYIHDENFNNVQSNIKKRAQRKFGSIMFVIFKQT